MPIQIQQTYAHTMNKEAKNNLLKKQVILKDISDKPYISFSQVKVSGGYKNDIIKKVDENPANEIVNRF